MKVARTVLRGAHFRNEVRLPDLTYVSNLPIYNLCDYLRSYSSLAVRTI